MMMMLMIMRTWMVLGCCNVLKLVMWLLDTFDAVEWCLRDRRSSSCLKLGRGIFVAASLFLRFRERLETCQRILRTRI